MLNWNPPPKESQNGIIRNYTVQVSVSGSLETFEVYSSTTNVTLSSLRPFQTYSCVVSAATIIGQGPPSTVFTITTQEDGK